MMRVKQKKWVLIHYSFHSFIHSFDKYLLNTYHAPGPVFRAGNTSVSKTDRSPGPLELPFQ